MGMYCGILDDSSRQDCESWQFVLHLGCKCSKQRKGAHSGGARSPLGLRQGSLHIQLVAELKHPVSLHQLHGELGRVGDLSVLMIIVPCTSQLVVCTACSRIQPLGGRVCVSGLCEWVFLWV